MINILKKIFFNKFDTSEKPKIYFAPGRINIIGEHIDYNGGYVLPMSINLGTYAAVNFREDNLINFVSYNFKDNFLLNEHELKFNSEHNWANYPKGVISVFEEAGFRINKGFNVLYHGNLPKGAGLSSSASIELVTAVMLNDLFDFKIDMLDLVKFSKKAENEYMGLNCGIMDQFAIGMGKKNHSILLDSNSLEFEYIPMNLGNYTFLITNSMKVRKLVESKYNERQNECNTALKLLQKELIINNLCQLSVEDFNLVEYIFDENIKKRTLHVVSENQRTKKAAEFLKNNDLHSLGELLNQSHLSLKNNYEVTGYELDTLQEISVKQDGVIGSRMTGAGFGGCTITLIDKSKVDDFIKNVEVEYTKKTGLEPEFYIVESEDMARKIC